jgi:hypothetical protein
MDPTQHPVDGSGTSTFEPIMGGRYLVENSSGDMPGMGPFEGLGMLGYNNLSGEYEHVWVCDSSTAMMISKGKANADGSIVFRGEMPDPLTRSNIPCRMVWTDVSADEKRFEMYCTKSGKEEKAMEATYTRGATSAR